MPTWLEIVLLALVAVTVVLALAGMAANSMRRRSRERGFVDRVAEANRALAAAHAADRGWEPAVVERAAREAFAAQRPGSQVKDVVLVQVIDRPGTDEDKAIFRFTTADEDEDEATVRLGRRGDDWTFEQLD